MGSGSSGYSSRSPVWRSRTTTGKEVPAMGPDNDPLHGKQVVVQWFDPDKAEWVALESVSDVEFVPSLPPGQVLGEVVQQVRPGVYEIPDSLLVSKGVQELWSFSEALRQEFARANPDLTVTIERDVVRRSTLFSVTRDGRAPEEDL
jgi:hypothetical protein